MLGHLLIGVMFGGVGAWLVYKGIAAFVATHRLVTDGITARGTVVAHETQTVEGTDDRGFREYTTYYYPIVEFKDVQGNLRRVKTSTGGSFPERSAVTLLYSDEGAGRVEIKSFGQLWLIPTAVTGTGMLLVAVTLAVWVFNVTVSTPFDRWTNRAAVPADAPAASPAKKALVDLGPIVIREVEPYSARIGVPITLRGSNFGRPGDHRVSIGGHGMSVNLEVLKWENDTVTVRIPADPRLLPDRSYYYRIDRQGTPVASSNLFMFGFEASQ